MKYRREIDGLRAVAVLSVIFFHAGFNVFKGGFVGVDIFFVISGYLITTIILAEKEKDTFSLVRFYERRARRLLPVLFFVMLSCVPFAWLWLLPVHLKDFFESLVAVSVFSSNFLFWLESGYFATTAELKPLLHTWSLAVEEQYYLLFPLFIMFIWKLNKRWIAGSIVVIAVASLALAQWGTYLYSSATFFLLPTRAWELAIGALIACGFLYQKKHTDTLTANRTVNEIFGGLGAALVCYSIVVFNKSTPFPGFYALIPTLGTGLIIVFTTPQTVLGKLLGTKIMVGIGLISYSAYLWHQPLFVFARHYSLTEPSTVLLLTLAAATLGIAYLSWRYVEMPFRKKTLFSQKCIFRFAVIGSVIIFFTGLVGIYGNGWPSRVPQGTYDLVSKARQNPFYVENRFADPGNPFQPYPSIVALFGDSFASQLAMQVDKEAYRRGLGFVGCIFEGCPPVRGVYRRGISDGKSCYDFNEQAYEYILKNSAIEYVVMAASWSGYLNMQKVDSDVRTGSTENAIVVARKKGAANPVSEGQSLLDIYKESLNIIIDSGKKLVLVYPIPSPQKNVPDYLLKASFLYGKNLENIETDYGSTDYQSFKDREKKVYEAFDLLSRKQNVIQVFPEKIFCNKAVPGRCVVQDNGNIFYSDSAHLANYGQVQLVKEIFNEIDKHQRETMFSAAASN